MATIKRAISGVNGLSTQLSNLNNRIDTEVGDLTTLTTTAKTSAVAAINELKTDLGSAGGDALLQTQNLADLNDASVARTNLDVYSTTEVDDAITSAQLALGSNYDVADITARNALTGLATTDRVFVSDDGDGKWALYKPTAVDGSGVGTAWAKLADQDSLQNSIDGPGIKAAYEANADTNAFTDAAKSKTDNISITTPRDLDKVVQNDELQTDLTDSVTDQQVPSAAAVKNYTDSIRTQPSMQNIVVSAGQVTLAQEPIYGTEGIMNFGCCRHINGSGEAFDAPLIGTADPKVFDVSTDVPGEWDGQAVAVQYLFNAVPA